MPNNEATNPASAPRPAGPARRRFTLEELQNRVKACTLKIGVAKRIEDNQTVTALRERRALATRKLAERHNVWTLINPEGKTEFVDFAEWEHRMVAWGRRNNLIPAGRVAEVVAQMRRMNPHLVVPPTPPPVAPQ